jgi:hypothetical protein
MPDDFQTIIDRYHARMAELREVLERDGRIHAVRRDDPSYSILLKPERKQPGAVPCTSFRGKTPVGHREYDRLDGGGPTQNGLQEFSGGAWRLLPLPKRMRERRLWEQRKAMPPVRTH